MQIILLQQAISPVRFGQQIPSCLLLLQISAQFSSLTFRFQSVLHMHTSDIELQDFFTGSPLQDSYCNLCSAQAPFQVSLGTVHHVSVKILVTWAVSPFHNHSQLPLWQNLRKKEKIGNSSQWQYLLPVLTSLHIQSAIFYLLPESSGGCILCFFQSF